MPKFVIERDIADIGDSTQQQLQAIAKKSCSVVNAIGPQIQWVHSYFTDDRVYCVYIAPNQEMIRDHAARGGFPANRISEVRAIVDPTTAEGVRATGAG